MFVYYTIIFAVVVFGVLIIRGRLKPPPPSGFLSDYARLKKDPSFAGLLWWERPNIDWKAYDRILLEPVEIYLHSKKEERRSGAVDTKTLKQMAEKFHDIVDTELKDYYYLTDASDEKVLRIRSAVTDVKLSSPWLNILAVFSVMVPVHFGGASMEAEFLDGATGEAIGAVVARGRGSLLQVMPGDLVSRGHAVGTFKRWAKLLRKSLEEVNFPLAPTRHYT